MKKTPGDIIILHKCTKNYDRMMYISWDIVHDGCNYFSFWAIFSPFIPWTARKIKFWKNEKKACRYHHFTYVYQKLWSDNVLFLRYAVQQTDRRTDGWEKWHIEVGAPPKYYIYKNCSLKTSSRSFSVCKN